MKPINMRTSSKFHHLWKLLMDKQRRVLINDLTKQNYIRNVFEMTSITNPSQRNLKPVRYSSSKITIKRYEWSGKTEIATGAVFIRIRQSALPFVVIEGTAAPCHFVILSAFLLTVSWLSQDLSLYNNHLVATTEVYYSNNILVQFK